MNIGVVGMGLIGGSICKSIKRYTNHTCFGYDLDNFVIECALNNGDIDFPLDDFAKCDMVFVCLHPQKTVEFMLEHKDNFGDNSIICDVCGVKKYIADNVDGKIRGMYVGCHPMAGTQFVGYQNSKADMFLNASFIITKTDNTNEDAVNEVSKFAKQIGFTKIIETTPQKHDEIITYTSQLAHIVSNAYVKSPTNDLIDGFTGGSFEDLTRVANLNEDMWTELFLLNKDNLIHEIEIVNRNLQNYLVALKNADRSVLQALLKDGSERKRRGSGVDFKQKSW